ncbi:MAG TPA: hypothetical protein VGJ20_37995 [Xanthobacteraceae bacterium]
MAETLLLFKPQEWRPIIRKLIEAPSAERLRRMLGGDPAGVPEFDSIEYDRTLYSCVALCNARGAYKRLHANAFATLLWHHARRRNGLLPNSDFLAGPVAVIFGN